MSRTNGDRQRRLLRAQLKAWGAAAVIASALYGVFSFFGSLEASDAIEDAQDRSRFWLTIAGEAPPNFMTPDSSLATDLKDRLGPIQTNVTELPLAITSFKGNNNSYGGISDALSFNPFNNDGAGCSECGTLTTEVQSKLLLIKQGRVDEVVRSEQPPPDEPTSPMRHLITVATFWLLGGTVTHLSIRKAHQERYGYQASELKWTFDGDGDGAKLANTLMAPLIVVPERCRRRHHRVQFERTMRQHFPMAMDNLGRIRAQIATLEDQGAEPAQIHQLRDAHDDLRRQIEQSLLQRDTHVVQQSLQRAIAHVNEELAATSENLRFTDEAAAELNRMTPEG